jgi:4-hydroxy-4-methyl-2-oxoglutarate aldolase
MSSMTLIYENLILVQGRRLALAHDGEMDAIARRLARLDSCAVCDALDSLSLPGAALGLHAVSTPRLIAGRVITVDLVPAATSSALMDDGAGAAPKRHLGTAAVDAASPGDVIVVAHHGRTDVAGWGGVLSAGAVRKGIAGVIVDGAVRDVDQADGYGLPVYAAAAVPRTARGRVTEREWNIHVTIAGVAVRPGDYVIADGSGVVFVPRDHARAVLAKAEQITRVEELMAGRALAGDPMTDVMSHDYESMLSDSDGGEHRSRG